MSEEKLLTICIPSYNRFDELRKLLNSISLSKSNDFNVYIVDNGSHYRFEDKILEDSRFVFVERRSVVPGPVNLRTSLEYGNGKYKMICLDKDYIIGEYLDNFLDKLRDIEVPCGYCQLNSDNIVGKFIINKSPLKYTIYRCGHPSGMFFRRDVIKEDSKIINWLDTKSIYYNNPFSLDLLYANGLLKGYEAIYNGSIIIPETKEKAAATKSYTYSEKGKKIYFFPECRIKQFDIFLCHMKLLKINNKYDIIEQLFKKTLLESTIGFHDIMLNDPICKHHGLSTRKIGKYEILGYANNISIHFMNCDLLRIKKLIKMLIVIRAWCSFIPRFILIK